MKDIKDFMIDEARMMSWANVHDAILNLVFKYYSKPGVS